MKFTRPVSVRTVFSQPSDGLSMFIALQYQCYPHPRSMSVAIRLENRLTDVE